VELVTCKGALCFKGTVTLVRVGVLGGSVG